MYTYMYIHICMYIYVYMYICVYVYEYVLTVGSRESKSRNCKVRGPKPRIVAYPSLRMQFKNDQSRGLEGLGLVLRTWMLTTERATSK